MKKLLKLVALTVLATELFVWAAGSVISATAGEAEYSQCVREYIAIGISRKDIDWLGKCDEHMPQYRKELLGKEEK